MMRGLMNPLIPGLLIKRQGKRLAIEILLTLQIITQNGGRLHVVVK